MVLNLTDIVLTPSIPGARWARMAPMADSRSSQGSETPTSASDSASGAAPASARAVADAYLDARVLLDPAAAAYLGLHQERTGLGDWSPDGFAAIAEQNRRSLAALDALPPAGPGAGAAGTAGDADAAADRVERDCARLLRERLTAELALHEAEDHFVLLNNIDSPVHRISEIFSMVPTATDEDWARMAERLRDVPRALDSYRTTLAEGLRRRRVVAERQVVTVGEQLGEWLGQGSADGPWFSSVVAPGPEARRAELDAAAAGATAAVAEFRSWLLREYAPATDGVPDAVGRERYLRAARDHNGADLDLDEAYRWAWGEFHRLFAEQRAEAERVLPGAATPLEAMEHLETHGPSVQGVDEVRAWLQNLMDQAIDTLDGSHFDISGPVRRVEAMIAPPGSAAAPYYSSPSLDFSRPGRTWLPTLGRDTFPTWQLVSTWYHEGVPGHHLQLAQWVACADRLSRYQASLGSVSANVEGWALYAERLMDELGFFSDPALRLGFLDEQMLRTIRVIIDIGMHLGLEIPADSPFHPGERWTPALGEAFFATFNGSPEDTRRSEIVRYLGWPGQAIGYKLGERTWREGREAAQRARAARGEKFDAKSWHMAALSQGSLGLDDLRDSLAAL